MKDLQSFSDWHYDLKQQIEQQGLNRSQEEEYFDSILQEKSGEYFFQLEQLAYQTAHFDQHQKEAVFHSAIARDLQQLLKNSPFYYHSIFKPRGYPGDAETMAMFYRNQYEGSDAFSRFMHKIGMASAIGQAIRNRKDWMVQSFKKHQPCSVLSLAAGPAQEIKEFQYQQDTVKFLALDHDIQTLKDATNQDFGVNYGIINAFHLIKGHQHFLVPKDHKLPYCKPKKDGKGWRKLWLSSKYHIKKLESESFDLVYSIGLFDYIRSLNEADKGAKALTAQLFDLLKPGGQLIIGNISPQMPLGIRWIMECICDWYLIYRNKSQLFEFVEAIPEAQIKTVHIDHEPLGINWMMTIEKK